MPTPPDRASSGQESRAQRRRTETRRVFQVALGISILLHLLVGITVQFRYDTSGLPSRPITIVQQGEPDHGTRVHNIVPVEGNASPIEAQVRTFQSTQPSFVAPAGQGEGVVAPRAGGERREIAPIGDRLRPRMGHAGVWNGPVDVTPSPEDIVRQRVAQRLAQYNDSVAAESARRARAVDWTVRDGNGGRWGVSPSGIHLGSVTVPIDPAVGDGQCLISPPGTEGAAGRSCWRDEAGGGSRAVQWAELQAQANQRLVREMFDDRVRLVRERRAAERDSAAVIPPGGS
jgi:hypothetical protein